MNIAVITKEVPDTEARLSLKDGQVDFTGVAYVINPFDEYALEEALRIKDKHPDTKVTVVMVGQDSAKKNLLNCLALGADEVILVTDSALEGSDPITISKVLAEVIRPLSPAVIFAGKQGVDYDWGLTGIALATELGLPHVGVVKSFEPDFASGTFRAISEADEGDLVYEGKLPAVITAEKGLNEPRYASLKGIMGAKKKPLNQLALKDLSISEEKVGIGAQRVKLVRAELPPEKKPGIIIEGESTAEKVAKLVQALHEEAKVI